MSTPIARGPLAAWHRARGATLVVRDGWEIAIGSVAPAPGNGNCNGNFLVDRSHRPTFEFNGPDTGSVLAHECGAEVPLRGIVTGPDWEIYRLTPERAIAFGRTPQMADALDVTGGWASLAIYGPDCERLLNKVTAVDLRERTLPPGRCCQGPVFGVNTLFGRFDDRFELHVCSDSATFFVEVLMDAGREFNLVPAGSGLT